MADPPYGIIFNLLKRGDVIPFLGAGASFVGRPADAVWNPAEPKFLPSGGELSRFLAEEAEFPADEAYERSDLAKVSSYYVDVAGRRTLRDRLREVLFHDYETGALHRFLAEVPSPLLIVVTNYDTLVEEAFNAAGKPFDVVVYPADRKDVANAVLWWPHGANEPKITPPNELFIDLATTTVIFKMHGSIRPASEEWDGFVITEEDYVEFLSRMTMNSAIPALFSAYFRDRSFLFLGYSLRDWNLRVVLKNLSKCFAWRGSGPDEDPVPSWAIQRQPTELEVKLWKKRNVNIFDVTIEEFVARMRERLGK
jgi:hypothetical protein